MKRLSPGLLQGCFELLTLTTKQPLTLPAIQSSFPRFASLPTEQIVEVCQTLNWLEASTSGIASATLVGARLIAEVGYEAMLRRALLDFIDVIRPTWIQNASYGRSRVLSFLPNDIAQVFVEADLAEGSSEDIVAFWDELAAHARGQRNDRLNQIGRIGERLTLAFEEVRTGKKPRWISIDNNADGYDVLSIVALSDPRKLSIEVKTSSVGLQGSFFLTRNEWDRAEEAEAHLFHLWDISTENHPVLAVVPISEMHSQISIDRGLGAWQQIEVPFCAFENEFKGA